MKKIFVFLIVLLMRIMWVMNSLCLLYGLTMLLLGNSPVRYLIITVVNLLAVILNAHWFKKPLYEDIKIEL